MIKPVKVSLTTVFFPDVEEEEFSGQEAYNEYATSLFLDMLYQDNPAEWVEVEELNE